MSFVIKLDVVAETSEGLITTQFPAAIAPIRGTMTNEIG